MTGPGTPFAVVKFLAEAPTRGADSSPRTCEEIMTYRTPCLVLAALLMAACAREETNTDGNGPGNADGVGGREDPPVVTQPGIPEGGPTAPAPEDSATAPSEPPASEPPAQ